MASSAEIPARRLYLTLHEAPAILWLGRFDPPLAELPDFSEVKVGRWHAPTGSTARTMLEDDGTERLLIQVTVRFLSQLRHALLREPGDVLPVALDPAPEPGPVLAGLDKGDLEQVIEATEAHHELGLRTRHFSPPVYLRFFWGETPKGREYGKLDAMIARLSQFNIVPDALLAKARDPAAPKNWAAVAPADLPERQRILDGLAPLIEHRRGMLFQPVDGRSPVTVDAFASHLANLPVEDRPYFLLLVGGLDQISIEFQYFLQGFGAAGRLHFDDPEEYGRYAAKVIRQEASLADDDPVVAFAGTDTDDVAALNAEELMQPLAAEFAATGMPPLAGGRATKPRVLALGRSLPERSILVLAAHGYEPGRSPGHDRDAAHAEQRAFQGSPILDDFRGERTSGDGLLCAADLADGGPFVPGGVVVLHACHSAGTVDRETLPEWIHLATPPRLAPQRPFIGRLGQAMLASEAGPVAVYGHVNRSHQYAWYDPEGSGESVTRLQYRDLLAALVRGDPVGLGRERARRMTIEYMSQAITVSHQIEWLLTGRSRGGSGIGWPRKGVEPYERSFVQYSFGSCNFRNYIILGDPMVRLTRRPAAPAEGGTT